MGGMFGIVSRSDCVKDLYYGTDYHSHLGTRRGGMAVHNPDGFIRYIHNIENAQFRSKFEDDIARMSARKGIGIISDYEDQPLLIRSHLGDYAIATVGAVRNAEALGAEISFRKNIHFSEMSLGEINPTELIASLINQESSFVDGIRRVQESVQGSCSILILTSKGIYAARDFLGRTPLILGDKPDGFTVTSESCALPNLDFIRRRHLGPGEIVFISENGVENVSPPGDRMQICAFLWVYYGYPASHYEGINVEAVRYKCGEYLAKRDEVEADMVAGIPDSGSAHGLGYAAASGIPFQRPFVKYTPTWPRSFMPQNQAVRDTVARMKLIPIQDLICDKRVLFCEDSIVRGTQLKDTIARLFEMGVRQVHMRPACPPLTYGCKFLNFSRSKSELDLAARRAVQELEGEDGKHLKEYSDPGTDRYHAMIEQIRKRLNLTSLRYQRLEDLVAAIGLPKDKLCTFCWDGAD